MQPPFFYMYKKPQQPKHRIAHLSTHRLFYFHQPDSIQSQIKFKLAVWTYVVNIQMHHHKWGRETWLFLSRSQGWSNYHKEMQAFLWMGIISLHSRQSLIHFRSGACMDFVKIQMYHHERRRAWPFSFQMAGLFKLRHGKVSISRDWALFQSDIANNLWFISNL